MSTGAHRVRPATPAEWRGLGDVLGAAFQDDPVWQWVTPDPSRRERHLGSAFGQLLKGRVATGDVLTNDDLSGAALWTAPGSWRMTARENLRMALPMTRAVGPGSVAQRLRTLSVIDRHHPREPHWYLMIIGADPTRRGQGIGSALMEPVVGRCDDEGMPAYLESSKEENLAFYHRFGFEVTGELQIHPDCPPMWTMWRNPR